LNWVHKAGTYYFKVIARDKTKPNENWQISYDEAVKDANGFPVHGVVKFDIAKNGVGTVPVVSNVAPIAYNQSVSAISKNTSTEITLIASDAVERSPLSFLITAQPSNGNLTLDAANMRVLYIKPIQVLRVLIHLNLKSMMAALLMVIVMKRQ